jgi:dolichyl-phosphate beta-glucosyltransferase
MGEPTSNEVCAKSQTRPSPRQDTQCGAKLFRVTSTLRSAIATPFLTRWVFDVELIARFVALAEGSGEASVESSIVEYPLHSWEDVAGSKVS